MCYLFYFVLRELLLLLNLNIYPYLYYNIIIHAFGISSNFPTPLSEDFWLRQHVYHH